MEEAIRGRDPPSGFNVMVVDDNPICLLVISKMLANLKYRVLPFQSAAEALYVLQEGKRDFDLILVEVHVGFTGFVSMTGFRLLDHIEKEMDIPVITMCAHKDQEVLFQSLSRGASFHFTKPMTLDSLEVVRQKALQKTAKKVLSKGLKLPCFSKNMAGREIGSFYFDKNEGINGLIRPKRTINQVSHSSDMVRRYDSEQNKDTGSRDGYSKRPRKERMLWDFELHERFLKAVEVLGENALPRKILHMMNVEGVSVKQIASHLQKHRAREEKAKKMKKANQNLVKSLPYQKPSNFIANEASGLSSSLPVSGSELSVLLPRIPSNIKEQYPTRLWTQVDQRLAQIPKNNLMGQRQVTNSLIYSNHKKQTMPSDAFKNFSGFRQLNHLDYTFGRKRTNWERPICPDLGPKGDSSGSHHPSVCILNSSSSNSLIQGQTSSTTAESYKPNLDFSRGITSSSRSNILLHEHLSCDVGKLPSLGTSSGLDLQQIAEKNATKRSSGMEENETESIDSSKKKGLIQGENTYPSDDMNAVHEIFSGNQLQRSLELDSNTPEDDWATLEALWSDQLQGTIEGEPIYENLLEDENVGTSSKSNAMLESEFDNVDVLNFLDELLDFELSSSPQEKDTTENSMVEAPDDEGLGSTCRSKALMEKASSGKTGDHEPTDQSSDKC